MIHRISFEIYGECFEPKAIDFKFTDMNSVGDIEKTGRFKGEELKYGSASYIVPKEHMIGNPFKHISQIFEPLLNSLKDNGADTWHIEIGRLYYAQCNEELSYEEIVEIAKLKCSVSYAAYSVSEEEEKEGWS